jgi:hypothetical protein
MAPDTNKVPVLVTTQHRGVFFGYIDPAQRQAPHVDMIGVRMCLYWHASVGGFLGLTSRGPNSECRISARSGGVFTARDVTSITDCSPEAVKAWEAA